MIMHGPANVKYPTVCPLGAVKKDVYINMGHNLKYSIANTVVLSYCPGDDFNF